MNRKNLVLYVHNTFHETTASLAENLRFPSLYPVVEEK